MSIEESSDASESMLITRFDVFVPGAYPFHSYVKRIFINNRTQENFDPEEAIKETLKQQGVIAQVVGPSKCGKTSAVENCVGEQNIVLVPGAQITDSVSLWDIVLKALQQPSSVEVSDTDGSATGGEAKVSAGVNVAFLAKAEAEASASCEKSKEHTETTNITFDPYQVAITQLKARNKVLFIDDFHTIVESQQPVVAAQLKAAAQARVKICLAEVPHHSDSTISALPDLTGRVQKTQFQYWSQDDLVAIGANGFQKLNATLSSATLEALSLESAGSPQLMQLICLHVARFLGIDERLKDPAKFQLDVSQIRKVLLGTHSLIDRGKIFGILDRGPDERGKSRKRYSIHALDKGDNYEIALAAISLSPPAAELVWNSNADNILKRIDKICKNSSAKPAKNQIIKAISQMQALAEKHMPRQPIIEWSDGTGLHILDPYFLFYLRWSEKYEKVRSAIS